MIAGLSASASAIDFNPYDITQIFANTYYRRSIGGQLFVPDNLNGSDGLGTSLVKSVIKGKTEAEFASAEMADLLNNGRTGADAPWEYVAGNLYPTLKKPGDGTDPDNAGSGTGTGGVSDDDTGSGSGGGTDTGTGTDSGAGSDTSDVDTSDPQAPAMPVEVPDANVNFDSASGTETVEVPVSTIETAIARATETAEVGGVAVETVVIEAPAVSSANAVEIVIPVSGLSAVANSTAVENIKIASAVGEVTLDTAAAGDLIAEVGSAETVEVVIERKGTGTEALDAAQLSALSGEGTVRAAYDVSLKVDGVTLPEFETDGKLTIGLPYTLGTGETASGVWAVYVSSDGAKRERMADSRYDATRKLVVFTTNNLSTYAVIYDASTTNNTTTSTEGTGSGGGCDAGTGAMALV
jgi:hypothetical protein